MDSITEEKLSVVEADSAVRMELRRIDETISANAKLIADLEEHV